MGQEIIIIVAKADVLRIAGFDSCVSRCTDSGVFLVNPGDMTQIVSSCFDGCVVFIASIIDDDDVGRGRELSEHGIEAAA